MNFEQVRKQIGKDISIKLAGAKDPQKSTALLDWEMTIGFGLPVFKVADDYRTNPISQNYQRYTVVYLKNGFEGRLYINVKDYLIYITTFFNKRNRLSDFIFIYAWDKEKEKNIIVWENDTEKNEIRVNKDFAQKFNEFGKLMEAKYKEEDNTLFVPVEN